MSSEEIYLYNSHDEFICNAIIAKRPLADLVREIQHIYKSDTRPWVVGFSGGKDSTVVLSLVYFSLISLPDTDRIKPVYVVSSDTLVETPVVVDMIKGTLDSINEQAQKDHLPISAHPVTPNLDDTFWVNLIGKGYPAPTRSFRWCTERMKINPVSAFILEKVADFGEVIVILGSRSQESASRAQVIAKHKIDGSALSRHTSLPNAYTYMPIETWSADDVWEYLMSAPRPWGGSNRQLFELYKGSNAGECPLVIDTSTPSCGNSRFGCWTCTVVTKDKAIEGLIESGDHWMQPLLDFRNKLHHSSIPENKSQFRNYRRRTGKVTYARGEDISDDSDAVAKHIPGPYWITFRKELLKELLTIERSLRDSGHPIELIGRIELQNIRQNWLRDPNEPDWQDTLPQLFNEVYPDEKIEWVKNDAGAFSQPDADLLLELEEKYDIPAAMVMRLIDTELSYAGLAKRRGILDALEGVLAQDWESLERIHQRKQASHYKSEFSPEAAEISRAIEALIK